MRGEGVDKMDPRNRIRVKKQAWAEVVGSVVTLVVHDSMNRLKPDSLQQECKYLTFNMERPLTLSASKGPYVGQGHLNKNKTTFYLQHF